MKHYFKKFPVFLYICVALIAYSCAEEKDFVKGQNHEKIKMENQSFDKLLQLPVFNDAYQRVVKTKVKIANSAVARTALEEQYGFDIVTQVPVRIITTADNGTYYVLLIERPIKEDLKFENLIINVKDTVVGALIMKYELSQLAEKEVNHDSYSMDIVDTAMTLLEVDGRIMFQSCIDTYTLMCNYCPNSNWSPNHLATQSCINANIDLYVVHWQVCTTIEEAGGGVGGTGPAGEEGGSPVGSVYNAPLPCIECIEEDDCNTSKEKLALMFPNAPISTLQTLAQMINDKGKDFGIDTKEELQHFLTQAGHESNGFSSINVTENLNYTTPSRIAAVWPSRFSLTDVTKLNPTNYVNDPFLLGNAVYHDRMGNGDVISGDGYNYRGRGIVQLTGKTNYTDFESFYNQTFSPLIDILNNPDSLASDNNLSILSALWFFKVKVLDKITVDANTTVKAVTFKVNGGYNGLPDRNIKFNNAVINIDCID